MQLGQTIAGKIKPSGVGAVVAFTSVANLISKGLQFILVYQAFALTRPYLGAELFGVFSTILGYGAFLSILDLGMGNVLIGLVVRAKASGNQAILAQEIRCGIGALVSLGIVAAFFLLAVVIALPVTTFFAGLPQGIHNDVRGALLVFLLGYACTLPAQGVVRMFQGMQRAYLAYSVMAVATLLSMLLLPLAIRGGQDIKLLLVLSYLLPAASPLLLLPLLWRHTAKSRWNLAALRERLPKYVHDGGIFFFLQLGALAAWGIDSALVASHLGSIAAGQYAIVQRLFQLVSFPLAILSAPLWPVYSDAMARSDSRAITRILFISMSLSGALSFFGVVILANWHQEFIALWLGHGIHVPLALVYVYAAWTVMECMGNSYAMFLNGLNLLRIQLFTNIAFFTLAIAMKIGALDIFGLYALPASSLLSYLLLIVLPYAFVLRPHSNFKTT